MTNPFSISGSWNIDPDNRQDRGCSEVEKVMLSPAEIEKLLQNTGKTVRKIEEVDSMRNISIEQLTEECRKLGFKVEAYKIIAKKYGYSNPHSIACLVSRYNIKKHLGNDEQKQEKDSLLEQEKSPVVEQKKSPKVEQENYTVTQAVLEPTPGPGLADGGIHDSGKREECGTGAVRDTQEGKGRFDLITPEGLFRLARWYELGANKYKDRKWEMGIPVTRCISSAFRHLVKYMAGYRDEDHLAAVAWDVFAIMHFERFMPELDDRPNWTKEAQGIKPIFFWCFSLSGIGNWHGKGANYIGSRAEAIEKGNIYAKNKGRSHFFIGVNGYEDAVEAIEKIEVEARDET